MPLKVLCKFVHLFWFSYNAKSDFRKFATEYEFILLFVLLKQLGEFNTDPGNVVSSLIGNPFLRRRRNLSPAKRSYARVWNFTGTWWGSRKFTSTRILCRPIEQWHEESVVQKFFFQFYLRTTILLYN